MDYGEDVNLTQRDEKSEEGSQDSSSDLAIAYLELLKRMLTRYQFDTSEEIYGRVRPGSWKRGLARWIDRRLGCLSLSLCEVMPPPDLVARNFGRDCPLTAETMIGMKRLSHLECAMKEVVAGSIKGDFVETGIWRGGATIFMTAYLELFDNSERRIFAADSFQGLPRPDPRYPADDGDQHYKYAELSVSREMVEANFERYQISTRRVTFVEGWFEETLPKLDVAAIAILRLDGDMYSSTIQALEALYEKVSPGGFVIIDDYQLVGARTAVHDYLNSREEKPDLIDIDGMAVYWRVS